MRCKIALLMSAALLGLGACASVDPGFGDSVRYANAVQTVNPDPVYPADGAQPGESGAKAAKASERYRKGETKPVQAISIGGGGGGSSGGGSGPQ